MSDFEADNKELLADLDQSRAGLILLVEELRPEDFGQARRGSWSISKILDHVIHSERLYTQLVSTSRMLVKWQQPLMHHGPWTALGRRS